MVYLLSGKLDIDGQLLIVMMLIMLLDLQLVILITYPHCSLLTQTPIDQDRVSNEAAIDNILQQ